MPAKQKKKEIKDLIVKPKQALVSVKREERLPASPDPLSQYLTEVNKYPILSREEETLVAKHYAEFKDKESAQKLVLSNLRLVVKIAMEYRRAFTNVLDLIQEGNMGLMRAVSKYDLSKGTRFSYYASWWIKAFILKYLIDNFRLVKIGTTQAQKKLFYNLMKEKQKMEAMGFSPKSHLISERLDVKEKDVVEMDQRLSAREMSLDAPSPTHEGKNNLDFFASSETPTDTKMEQEELKKMLFHHLDEFVGALKEKEKKIFRERLYAEVPKTLQDIADEYGISRERIRQIEERVITKLQTFFKDKGFEVDIRDKQ